MDLMLHQESLNKLNEEFELRQQGRQDIQNYQKKEKESKRKSLEMRLQSHKNYKMEQLKVKQQEDIKKGEGKIINLLFILNKEFIITYLYNINNI